MNAEPEAIRAVFWLEREYDEWDRQTEIVFEKMRKRYAHVPPGPPLFAAISSASTPWSSDWSGDAMFTGATFRAGLCTVKDDNCAECELHGYGIIEGPLEDELHIGWVNQRGALRPIHYKSLRGHWPKLEDGRDWICP